MEKPMTLEELIDRINSSRVTVTDDRNELALGYNTAISNVCALIREHSPALDRRGVLQFQFAHRETKRVLYAIKDGKPDETRSFHINDIEYLQSLGLDAKFVEPPCDT